MQQSQIKINKIQQSKILIANYLLKFLLQNNMFWFLI